MTDTATEPTTEPAADQGALDVLVGKALAEINKGSVTLADLLKALSPPQQSEPVPAVLPTPAEITTKQREAMARIPEVFGQVVPTERRALQPVEVSALVREKQTLDEITKMAANRLGDITVTVHNHLDVVVEDTLIAGQEPPLRDEKGHYIKAGKAPGPDVEHQFSRETRAAAASLPVENLKALEDSGDITHEDFLALTRQVRVVDEMNVIAALKKKPSLITAIAKATVPGKQGTSVYLRKK